MNAALFIALRRLRLPIIALILSYAISVTGLVLIPGIDARR
jgi:voltage-gated potassium channel